MHFIDVNLYYLLKEIVKKLQLKMKMFAVISSTFSRNFITILLVFKLNLKRARSHIFLDKFRACRFELLNKFTSFSLSLSLSLFYYLLLGVAIKRKQP